MDKLKVEGAKKHYLVSYLISKRKGFPLRKRYKNKDF